MSDRAAEAGFAPVSLVDAMARGGGFRPLSFAPATYKPQAAEQDSIDEPDLEDPFALGLAEGQRVAEAAFVAARHQLPALLAGAAALQDEPSAELAQLIATTGGPPVRPDTTTGGAGKRGAVGGGRGES